MDIDGKLRNSWTGLKFVLQQPDFDPAGFTFEMQVKGYPYDFLPKRMFRDMAAWIVMFFNGVMLRETTSRPGDPSNWLWSTDRRDLETVRRLADLVAGS